MKIFKKKTVETSNEYYEAYKAELSKSSQVEKNKLFSVNNFLKLEILAVAVGFLIMTQNDLSLELKKMYTAGNNVLPVSMQYASLDSDLVVKMDDSPLETINIREENERDFIEMNSNEKEASAENSDIELLIELLQAEMGDTKESVSDNRIVISQK